MRFNYKYTLSRLLLILALCTSVILSSCGTNTANETEPVNAAASLKEALTEAETEETEETETLSASEYRAELVRQQNSGPAFDWSNIYYKNGLRVYKDDYYTSKIVIDFSKSQSVKSWKKLKKKGIDAVILKIGSRGYTEGGLIENSKFDSNYRGAVENGMPVYGVYFFSQAVNAKEAKEEADFVLEKLKASDVSKDVLVFYDIEAGYDYSNGVHYRNYKLSNKQIRKNLKTFAKELEKNGYAVGVYSNLKWYGRCLKRSLFKGYPFWFACYKEKATIKNGLTLWQYSCQGLLDGISGHVDLNILFVPKS